MSINDLIHINAHNAFEQGVKTERQRIIELLEQEIATFGRDSWLDAIELIKGEKQ